MPIMPILLFFVAFTAAEIVGEITSINGTDRFLIWFAGTLLDTVPQAATISFTSLRCKKFTSSLV